MTMTHTPSAPDDAAGSSEARLDFQGDPTQEQIESLLKVVRSAKRKYLGDFAEVTANTIEFYRAELASLRASAAPSDTDGKVTSPKIAWALDAIANRICFMLGTDANRSQIRLIAQNAIAEAWPEIIAHQQPAPVAQPDLEAEAKEMEDRIFMAILHSDQPSWQSVFRNGIVLGIIWRDLARFSPPPAPLPTDLQAALDRVESDIATSEELNDPPGCDEFLADLKALCAAVRGGVTVAPPSAEVEDAAKACAEEIGGLPIPGFYMGQENVDAMVPVIRRHLAPLAKRREDVEALVEATKGMLEAINAMHGYDEYPNSLLVAANVSGWGDEWCRPACVNMKAALRPFTAAPAAKAEGEKQ